MSTHNNLAPTPPMGWNSFDCYGCSVTETEVKANADYMAAHLARCGYQYVVIDGGWSDGAQPQNMDGHGRLIPAPDKYPSSAGGKGFKPLADYVHSKGLKFGLHEMRGISRLAASKNLPVLGSSSRTGDIVREGDACGWCASTWGVDVGKPGGQEYYDSLLALYAEWGVDFIKVDDMSWPYRGPEIEAVASAIRKCGRPILLSLSPGDHTDISKAEHLKAHCEMWRITHDYWDRWDYLMEEFDHCRNWAHHIGPNHWPDPDMLPLGRLRVRSKPEEQPSKFTPDEQRTCMTLWCIARAPLMLGGDLPSTDEFTLSLIANEEVLAVDQKSANSRCFLQRYGRVAWTADDPETGDKFLALFNISDAAQEIPINVEEIGWAGEFAARDLWARQDLGSCDYHMSPSLPPHGAALYRLKKL